LLLQVSARAMKTQSPKAEAGSHRPAERRGESRATTAREARPHRPALHNGARADFATRVLASGVLAGLIVLGLPHLAVPYTLLKIALLVATELGLVSLLLGLFLAAKTSFAGLQLVTGSLVMLWLRSQGHPHAALAAGILILVIGLVGLGAWRSDATVPFLDPEWFHRRLSAAHARRRPRAKAA
jgi:hypothetical protein